MIVGYDYERILLSTVDFVFVSMYDMRKNDYYMHKDDL